MKDAPSQYRVGNLFLTKVSSFRDIRHTFQLDDVNTLRNYLVGMGFLLLNIFWGYWEHSGSAPSSVKVRWR